MKSKNFWVFLICAFAMFILMSQLLPNVMIASNSLVDILVIKATLLFEKEDRDNTTEIDPEKTNILIMMDDAWKSQYMIGFKTMKARKMVGSIAVITDMVNKPDYMNNAELFDVYTYGWDLMSHTMTHPDLSALSRKQQHKEILKAQKWLKQHNFNRCLDTIVYPYGRFNKTTLDIMKECDITSGRTTQSGFVNDKNINKLQVDAFVLTDETPEHVRKLINNAVQEDKTLILVFHKFSEGGEYSYEKDDFIEILDYMCSIREKLNIITYSQWIEYIDHIPQAQKIDKQ